MPGIGDGAHPLATAVRMGSVLCAWRTGPAEGAELPQVMAQGEFTGAPRHIHLTTQVVNTVRRILLKRMTDGRKSVT